MSMLRACGSLLRARPLLRATPQSFSAHGLAFVSARAPMQSLGACSMRFYSEERRQTMPVPVVESDDGSEPLIYNRPQKRRGKPWYKSPVLYVLAVVPVFTLWLGFWQLRRLKWKVALMDELDDKLRRDPLRFPRNINMDVLEEFEFRQFELQGRFDVSRALFVGPRSREGKRGYQLVVPFRRSSGGPDVLVNLGFVSDEHIVGTGMNKCLKHPLPYDGREVTIVTLLPRVYPPSRFALANEPNNNLWMQINPAQMAHWLNEQAGIVDASKAPDAPTESKSFSIFRQLTMARAPEAQTPQEAFQQKQSTHVLPVYVEQIFDGTFSEAGALIKKGIPVGRPPRIELRNQHAEYAATWFTLSALTSVMFVYMARKGRSKS